METKFFTSDSAASEAQDYADRNGGVAVHLNELTPAERKKYRVSDHDTVFQNGVNVRPFYVAVEKSADHPAHVIYTTGGTQIIGLTGEQVQAKVDAAVADAVAKAGAANQEAINKAVADAIAKMQAAPKA